MRKERIYELRKDGTLRRDRLAEFFEDHPWVIIPLFFGGWILGSIIEGLM